MSFLIQQHRVFKEMDNYRVLVDYFLKLMHNKVISSFQALRQTRAPVTRLDPVTEGSPQISGKGSLSAAPPKPDRAVKAEFYRFKNFRHQSTQCLLLRGNFERCNAKPQRPSYPFGARWTQRSIEKLTWPGLGFEPRTSDLVAHCATSAAYIEIKPSLGFCNGLTAIAERADAAGNRPPPDSTSLHQHDPG
ncbi:hypothetical protein PoB_007144800 [Plakobranchus ocellatus]|uniref:Uncharacterized protein n=1 Tax=Plakobranchus ocellatus TaxID=259542 RepID=A0AAV4DKY1_9GAST|nr:hypothetical protein PoB_007144800 [Plakobranchus ocellatus]